MEINWEDFRQDLDAKLEDIPVKPRQGQMKEKSSEQGTRIRISALASTWTKDRLRTIAATEISKLSDPFTKSRFPVQIAFNGEAIAVPRLDQVLFDHAHAECEAEFVVDGPKTRLEGKINYRLRNAKRRFTVDGINLLTATNVSSPDRFDTLGPFSVKFYWYNRQTLRQLEGVGELKQVIQELQERWAGGLMVFRDGFRVNPYGSSDDDWLNLDPIAFGSGGYKVNRRQIVGKVDISSIRNPTLIDQTNREGLRNSPEKELLIKLLQHLLLSEVKPFLEQCDEEASAAQPLTVHNIDKRVGREEKRMHQTLKLLKREYPEVERDPGRQYD